MSATVKYSMYFLYLYETVICSVKSNYPFCVRSYGNTRVLGLRWKDMGRERTPFNITILPPNLQYSGFVSQNSKGGQVVFTQHTNPHTIPETSSSLQHRSEIHLKRRRNIIQVWEIDHQEKLTNFFLSHEKCRMMLRNKKKCVSFFLCNGRNNPARRNDSRVWVWWKKEEK